MTDETPLTGRQPGEDAEQISAASMRRAVRLGYHAPLYEFVAARVRTLQRGYRAGESGAVAALARLRRAAGGEPGESPDVWPETLGLPDQYVGSGDVPSSAERSVHYALTLYAIHQQSKSDAMHHGGHTVGRSARQLSARDSVSEQAVLRRFQALGTASSVREAATHLRGLVTQFRGEGIPLDYGQLAVDLTRFQDPVQIGAVRLAWGRAYYRAYQDPRGTVAVDASSTESEGESE